MQVSIYLLLSSVLSLASSLELPKLPCELSWQEFNCGDEIPSDAVYTEPKIYFVVRGQVNNVTTRIGFYNANTQKAYIPLLSDLGFQGPSTSAVELLLNPNNCDILWEDVNLISPRKFPNNSYNINGDFVGKTIPQEGSPSLSGHIDFDAGGLYILDNELTHFSRQFKVLVSQTSDLQMEVKDFVFSQESSGSANDVLGLDEISNNAEVTIVQSIVHSKIVTERFQFKVDTGIIWLPLLDGKATISFHIWLIAMFHVKIPIRWAASVGVSGGFLIDTTKETEITVERKISVPPLTSIRACSFVSIQESSAMRWRAKTYYTAAGMNATKILPIVLEQGISDAYIYEGHVVKDLTGVFQGSMVMDSEFHVVEASNTEDCIF